MRTLKTLTALLTALISFSLFAVEGTYEIEMEGFGGGGGRGGGGDFTTTFTIVKADDGTYSGTWTSRGNDTEIEEITVDGNDFSFVLTRTWGDNTTEIPYEGTVEDGELSGSMTMSWGGQENEMKFTGTLVEEEDSEDEEPAEEAEEAPTEEA